MTNTEQDAPVFPGISHSWNTSGRLLTSKTAKVVEYDNSVASIGSQSLRTSAINKSDNENSLRRSTSQRVIGFFSDLLRTSTSSRSGSDQVQTPTTDRSVSGEEGVDENEMSAKEMGTGEQEGYEEEEYEEEEYQLDSRDRRGLSESRSQ